MKSTTFPRYANDEANREGQTSTRALRTPPAKDARAFPRRLPCRTRHFADSRRRRPGIAGKGADVVQILLRTLSPGALQPPLVARSFDCYRQRGKQRRQVYRRDAARVGKTTLCGEQAALFDYHRYVLFVGATASAARSAFNSIKADLDANDLIVDNFPEICYPIVELNGAANRAGGQHVAGAHTNIVWNNDLVVLPTTPNNPVSGAVLQYAGIEGRIRGMKLKNKATGENLRPTLCVIDDPQTDESARSDEQIKKRADNIFKAILNLPGPGEEITVFCPCTVIERNDLADQLLNRKFHPEWKGERIKALKRFPDNMELWTTYSDMRNKEFQEDGDGSGATDAGAEVSWPERFGKNEVSGLQFCMNKYFENEWAFMSEFQQEPKTVDLGDEQPTPAHTFAKLNNRPRFEVPIAANKVTAFVDVQKEALYYVVCAWTDDFSGQLIDYGTFPKQRRLHFESNALNPKLSDVFPRDGLEARLRKAFEIWSETVLGCEYKREDGSILRVGKRFIDASWGESTATVDKFCRESKFSPILTPSYGKFLGAQHKPPAFGTASRAKRMGTTGITRTTVTNARFDTYFSIQTTGKRLFIAGF